MNNNEIFDVFRTFSKEELRRFGNYLNSSYFNTSKKLLLLFNEIISYYPLFTDLRLSKEALFSKISPALRYKDSTMRNLFCDLHKSAMDFLTLEVFSTKKDDRKRYLMEELNNRKLNDAFYKTIQSIDPETENGSADWNYYLNRHFFELSKFNFSYLNDRILKNDKLSSELSFLNKSTAHLVYFYITELIANYRNLIIYSRLYDFELSSQWLYKIAEGTAIKKLKDILKDDENNSFILDIYDAMLEASSEPENEKKYFVYKKLVNACENKLSKDEISFHYFNFISYSTIKVNSDSPNQNFNFNDELFEIYKTMLDKEYYIDSKTNHLPHELYRSILMHGLRMKDYGWVESFINDYSRKVHPNDTDNMYNFAMAHLSYYRSDYGSALKYLQKIEQDYFIFKYDGKNLMLMVYYELGYTEECLYLCKTYNELLRNYNLLNPVRRKRFFNFVKYVERLTLYRAGTIRCDIGYLKRRLEKKDTIAFKDWLLEKISILERAGSIDKRFSAAV
jgi:hypothetical protein